MAALAAGWLLAAAAQAAEQTVALDLVDAAGGRTAIGTVRIVETKLGLAFYPELTGLPPGLHGFHVHANPSCAPASPTGTPAAAMAAGGHFDPAGSNKHGEPWGDGHLGDLPPLYVAADGTARSPVLAPRIASLSVVAQRALMIHAGGDNHADHPEPLGGGRGRIACGVIGG